MDFHSLTRRALQSLCKKNKIQANMTNVAMADALEGLPVVEGIEEYFQESQAELAAAPPEPQGSPLPRSRRVTARAPQVPKPGGSEEEMAGATTRRKAARRSTTKEEMAGDVGHVGTRRSTRGRAASKMACLRTEEEEAKDVVENALSNDPSTEEEMETKEGQGKKETNRMLPVEQPKEDQKEEEEEEEEEEEHSVLNGGIQAVEHTTVLNDEVGVEAAQNRDSEEQNRELKLELNVDISVIGQNRDSEEEEGEQNTEEQNRETEEEEEEEEEEEDELSDGGIQEVEETTTLNDEEAAVLKFSNGGLNDELGVEGANFQGSPVRGLISSEPKEESMIVDVQAATDQTSQVGIDDTGSVEFLNVSVESAHHDLTVESEKSDRNGSDHLAAEENEQSSNGDDDADHAADDDNFVEEEDFGDDELGGDSAIDILVSEHLTGEVAGEAAAATTSPAREVYMEEKKQFSNGDHTDHADDDDHTFEEEEFREAAAEISDENEKEEETKQYNNDIGNDPAAINSMTPLEMGDSSGEEDTAEQEELENTNVSGGDSAIVGVPVQIEDFGDEDLLGEIAVEAAATTTSYSPAEKVLSSEESPVPFSDAENNNNSNNNNKENGVDGDGFRKEAKLENLSLRKLKAMYKDTLLVVINKNKGKEKKRSALQALDENCLFLK